MPISAFKGENITQRLTSNHKMNWYKGNTLMELLDAAPVPQRDHGGLLRAVVSGKYKD